MAVTHHYNKALEDVALAAPAPATTAEILDERSSVMKTETHHDEDVKPKGDYSGAVAKTDPEELKLVRKLDRWIMVCLLTLKCYEFQGKRQN